MLNDRADIFTKSCLVGVNGSLLILSARIDVVIPILTTKMKAELCLQENQVFRTSSGSREINAVVICWCHALCSIGNDGA